MGYRWPIKPKRSKYGAVRTNGMGSMLEAAVYQILELRQKAGHIADLKQQVSVELGEEFFVSANTGKIKKRIVRWKVDFSYFDKALRQTVWAEAKGVETAHYRKQKRLWKAGAGPGRLEIYKGSWRRPRLVEVIEFVA